jgi:hypothetical protein
MAVLLAKAALFRPGLSAYLPDRGDGRADRPAWFGYHRVHAAQATIADERVRPGDQLLDLLLILSAERARQKDSRTGHSPNVFEPQHLWPQDDGCRWPAHGGSPRAYRAWPLAWFGVIWPVNGPPELSREVRNEASTCESGRRESDPHDQLGRLVAHSGQPLQLCMQSGLQLGSAVPRLPSATSAGSQGRSSESRGSCAR